MKILNLKGYEVLLDDDDYDKISQMRGWYVMKAENHNSRTNYVTHDNYGRLHRYLLQIDDPTILVDHIDRNGLNNQRSNLRLVNCSENKRNSSPYVNNKFNFGGLSFEPPTNGRTWRIRARYSTNERTADGRGYKLKSKSFGPTSGKSMNELTRDAVLYRIEKMREYGYVVDERSETIEKECLKDDYDMEKILGISFKDFQVE